MFFSSCKLFGVCLCLCLSPSMLSRICHKLQEYKPVYIIHWENLTNVPFGMLLYGGLDSSLMVTMASWHLNDIEVANVWGAQLHIFSIDLKGTIDVD
jgi:hypothetical protein